VPVVIADALVYLGAHPGAHPHGISEHRCANDATNEDPGINHGIPVRASS